MNIKIFLKKTINTFLKPNLFWINYSFFYKKNNFLFTHLSKFFFLFLVIVRHSIGKILKI